jgi:hypothetical protein
MTRARYGSIRIAVFDYSDPRAVKFAGKVAMPLSLAQLERSGADPDSSVAGHGGHPTS